MPTDAAVGPAGPVRQRRVPRRPRPGTLFHPTFLYEIIWNVAGAVVILLWLGRRIALQLGHACSRST